MGILHYMYKLFVYLNYIKYITVRNILERHGPYAPLQKLQFSPFPIEKRFTEHNNFT